MSKPKLTGMIIAWASELWIGPAIKQALKYCDEVFVCIEPHSEIMKKYEDSTLDIAKRYKDRIKFVKLKDKMVFSNHATAKATILNTMMKSSKFFDNGNWYFILDVDEFYSEECIDIVRKIMDNKDLDIINFESKYFFIDTKHYLIGEHMRIFKVTDKENDHFIPTQNWSKRKVGFATIPLKIGMFHYGMMTNPYTKIDFWKSEYPNKMQSNKVKWIDKIYRNYDLRSKRYEEYWITKNEELFGIRSPWFSSSFAPNKDGKLFTYDGKHPKFVEEAGLTKIKDYREIYNFQRSEDE